MPWTFYNSNGQRLSTATTLIDNLDIDGATDIGAAIVDADLFIIDDGAGGTNRKTAASRLTTYIRGDVPGCRVTDAGGQAIANDTDTAINFDTERFDTDTMHDNSTNNTRITFTTAGVYIVGGHVQLPTHATGVRVISIREGGDNYIAMSSWNGNSANSHRASVTTVFKFAAAEYVELMIQQDSGGSLTTDKVNSRTPEFFALQVSA